MSIDQNPTLSPLVVAFLAQCGARANLRGYPRLAPLSLDEWESHCWLEGFDLADTSEGYRSNVLADILGESIEHEAAA